AGTAAKGVMVALGMLAACAGGAPPATGNAASAPLAPILPDIGTRMPDGTVYAGLSIETGKPSFIAAAGGRMVDDTIYAGLSPDTGARLYTTPADAPGVYSWTAAIEYCRTPSASGHK